MRTLASAVCAVFVAAIVLGAVTPARAAGKTHQVKATVVSIDTEGKTITIKDDASGEEKTAPVMDKAVKDLSTLKAGDHVTLTCTDDEQGQHQGVTAIKKG